MKKRESERFFRDANRRLEANEQAMSFFKKYGIHPETLRMLLIGMDEDENIVSPIYNNNNVILGKLTIQNIYEDPIYSHDSYGFVGNPRSKDKTITIAKNIIDVCLLWQLGIDNPVMIPDRDQVHYLHKYKELIFVDGDDSVVDLYPGIKNEYKIKDLPSYLQMHRELPEKIRVEGLDLDTELKFLPFIDEDIVYVHASKFTRILSSDNKAYRAEKIKNGLIAFKLNERVIYCKGGVFNIPNDVEMTPKYEIKEVYEALYDYLDRQLIFMSNDQCRLTTMFVIYAWCIYYKLDLKTHLHIIDPSHYQVNILFETLKAVMPDNKNLYSTPKAEVRNKEDQIFEYRYPRIIIDPCTVHGNYDFGPKILVNDESAKLRAPYSKSRTFAKVRELRKMLSNLLMTYKKPPFEALEEGLYNYYFPFYQVGKEIGMDQREIKDLFYTVCGSSQRVFKGLNRYYYREKHGTTIDQEPESSVEDGLPLDDVSRENQQASQDYLEREAS